MAESVEHKQEEEVYLIYGKNGWLGGQLTTLLREQGKTVFLGDARLQNREHVERYIHGTVFFAPLTTRACAQRAGAV
jgi:hypothetical protein